jgi:hypothetical protein
MSDQERLDLMLRRTMAADPAPALSPAFDRRLARRLRARRLSPKGRGVLALYALGALAVSVWAMRSEAFGWALIAGAVVLPLVLVALAQRRQIGFVSPGRRGTASD